MQIHYPLDPATGAENQALLPWTDGVPASGVEGSYPPFETVIFPMEEIVNAITAAGLTPTDNDLTQLFQALAIGAIWVGTLTYTAAQGQVAEAYSATIPGQVVLPAPKPGMQIVGLVPSANAGTAPTLAIAGFATGSGATAIKKRSGSAPATGDISAALTTFRFDGTNWRIVGLAPSDIITALPDGQVWHTGTAGGTSAALTTTLSPAPAHGAAGFFIGLTVPAGFANAVNATLAFKDASGATIAAPLVLNKDGSAVVGGEMPVGAEAQLFYDGTSARVMNSALVPPGAVATTTVAAPGVTLPRIFAWGNIDATSGVPVVTNGGGISSVSQVHAPNGGTNYTVNFTNAMPDTNFTAVFSVMSYENDTVALTAQESFNSRTTTSVTVLIDAPAYSAGIFDKFSVMIFHT